MAKPAIHPVPEIAARAETKSPAHQQVYNTLREKVLFGDFAPGQALTIQGLIAETGAGMTPVREAIRRLTSEGAVTMQGNRRLSVPKLSAGEIEQLVFMRTFLEVSLAERAVEHCSPDQIAQLRAIDARINEAISSGDIGGYLCHNFEFHTHLYALAEAPIIAQVAGGLWLRFGPSLRVVCGRYGTLNLPDKHIDILHALETGDVRAAGQAVKEDIEQGMRQILVTADSIDTA